MDKKALLFKPSAEPFYTEKQEARTVTAVCLHLHTTPSEVTVAIKHKSSRAQPAANVQWLTSLFIIYSHVCLGLPGTKLISIFVHLNKAQGSSPPPSPPSLPPLPQLPTQLLDAPGMHASSELGNWPNLCRPAHHALSLGCSQRELVHPCLL